MSKLAMHVAHYKRGAVGAIDAHNLRTCETHSNEDIDPERSQYNIQMLSPEGGSLYATVKEAAGQAAGRVTANSILVTEWVIYPPENLQDPFTADRVELERWGRDVLTWMEEKGLSPKSATTHLDETTTHMHVDTMPFTQDGRLSRKEVYTRSTLAAYHTELAAYLAEKGWDVQRGDVRQPGQNGKSKTVREYKAWAEKEKAKLEKEISAARAEAKEQVDAAKKEADAVQGFLGRQAAAYEENQRIIEEQERSIQETLDWLNSNPDLQRQVERTDELRRLRRVSEEAEQKAKAFERQLNMQTQLVACLREDLKARVSSYVELKNSKQEAWKGRSEAEQTVANLERALEDSGAIKGIIVRMALCGARAEAAAAREKHDALCAAVRAQKHKLQEEQQRLMKQSQDLDRLLEDSVDFGDRQPIERAAKEPTVGDDAGDR